MKRAIHSFVSLFVLLAGCDHASPESILGAKGHEATPSLIAETDRQFDFGAVIGRPGQKMDHRYRLANSSPHDVKIVNVVNRKTCCGIVRIGPSLLHPGEFTDVDVTLVVGDKFGGVVHETEVVTDLQSDSSIVLRTTASAHAAIRIEEISPSEDAILVGSKNPRRAEFRVFAAGILTDPPADLAHLDLRSTIKVEWLGAKEEIPSDDGLRVESRLFAAWLDPAGLPGDRTAEILLQDGKRVVIYKHVVIWAVVSPIVASPKMIVMNRGKRDYRVLIQSHDKTLFQIIRIECKVPGLQCRAVSSVAANTQVVEVVGVPMPNDGRGIVTVFTDHPGQEHVDLPFLVLE